MKVIVFLACLLSGYRRPSPVSALEKVIAVVFAMIGAPILLMYLSTVGSLMAEAFIKLRLLRCKNCATKKKGDAEEPDEEKDYLQRGRSMCRGCLLEQVKCRRMGGHKALVESRSRIVQPKSVWPCLILLFVYVFCGAFTISAFEGWNFIDSFYFCFTSLFTIGLESDGVDASSGFAFLVTVYLLFGLGLVAMCVNIIFISRKEDQSGPEGLTEEDNEDTLRISRRKRGS